MIARWCVRLTRQVRLRTRSTWSQKSCSSRSGRLPQEVAEARGGDQEQARGAVGAHGGRARLPVERRHLPRHRARVEVADRDLLAVRRLVGDLEPPLEEQHHVVAGVALLPQDGARVERHLAAERAEVGERPGQALHEEVRPVARRLSAHAWHHDTPGGGRPYGAGRA